jgi:hypothetical protein
MLIIVPAGLVSSLLAPSSPRTFIYLTGQMDNCSWIMVWRLTVRGLWSLVPGRGTIIRGFLTTCSSRVGVGSGFQSRGPFTTDQGRVGSGRVGSGRVGVNSGRVGVSGSGVNGP